LGAAVATGAEPDVDWLLVPAAGAGVAGWLWLGDVVVLELLLVPGCAGWLAGLLLMIVGPFENG